MSLAKILCWFCGARIIDVPPQLPVAIRRLEAKGFTIPPFELGFKKLPRTTLAQVVTNMGASCVMIDKKWENSDNETKIHTLIHELLHAYDQNIVDIAYNHEASYGTLTFAQRLKNADSLADLVNERSTRAVRDDPRVGSGTTHGWDPVDLHVGSTTTHGTRRF